MSLRLIKVSTFKETVRLIRPDNREDSFKVVFVHMKVDEYDEMMLEVKNGEIKLPEVLDRIIQSFDDVVDEDGKPADFNTTMDYIKTDMALINSITTKYVEVLNGVKTKNSKGSPKR